MFDLNTLRQMVDNPLGFEGLAPGPTEEQADALEQQRRQSFDVAQKFHNVFSTEDGAFVLRHLREMTIESSTWRASLGILEAVPHGFAREGQNALVRYCEDMVKTAKDRAQQLKQEAEHGRRESESGE